MLQYFHVLYSAQFWLLAACHVIGGLPYIFIGSPSLLSYFSSYSFMWGRYIYIICLHVASVVQSYTCFPDRPFTLMQPHTLSNHLLLGFVSSLSLVLPFPSPSLLHSAPPFASHTDTTSISLPGLSSRLPQLYLSLQFFNLFPC